ncbi:hypothetical protein CsatA_020183 [Cannabis sativa]
MGGVGKTALARDVYKDDYVTSKFDKMIWVSATNKYDLGPIMAAIMEALGQPAVFLEIENSVASFIEKVKRKKLFLVLDDVCLHLEGSVGLNPWRRLISAFMTSIYNFLFRIWFFPKWSLFWGFGWGNSFSFLVVK